MAVPEARAKTDGESSAPALAAIASSEVDTRSEAAVMLAQAARQWPKGLCRKKEFKARHHRQIERRIVFLSAR